MSSCGKRGVLIIRFELVAIHGGLRQEIGVSQALREARRSDDRSCARHGCFIVYIEDVQNAFALSGHYCRIHVS